VISPGLVGFKLVNASSEELFDASAQAPKFVPAWEFTGPSIKESALILARFFRPTT
jgi:hypothetical protein